MSLSTTLSIADHSAATKTFVSVSPIVGGSNRLDSSSTLAAPRTMSIRHTSTGKGSSAVDRHLVQFQTTKVDASGNPYTATVNLTIAMARSGAVTSADVLDMISFIKNFLTDANVGSILIGES